MTANHSPGAPAFAVGPAPHFRTAYAAHGTTPSLSVKAIGAIVAAHAAVLALLASLDAVPLPSAVSTLVVDLIQPAVALQPEIVQPQARMVEPRPQPRRQPAAQPSLSTTATYSTASTEAPVVHESPTTSPAHATSPTATVPPRFDADYLSNPAPTYPSLSRRLGEEGKVLLRVYVDASGRPSQIELKASSGSPRLDEAAKDAVGRWKFVPARRGDETTVAWVLVPIVFTLKH